MRAAEWLATGSGTPRAVVLGAPYGGASLSGAQCQLGPAAIREALARFTTWDGTRASSLDPLAVADAGDIEISGSTLEVQRQIAEAVAAASAEVTILLGGDNSVTVGGVQGTRADGLLTLDAHHDCREGVSNGSPVRMLIESGLGHVAQIGVAPFANEESDSRWAQANGVHVIDLAHVRSHGIARAVEGALALLAPCKRIFVDFDLDVLDRSAAPGTAASLPGGLAPSDLQEAAYLLGRSPKVVGCDLTELDPTTDVASATSRTAASVMLQFFAGLHAR